MIFTFAHLEHYLVTISKKHILPNSCAPTTQRFNSRATRFPIYTIALMKDLAVGASILEYTLMGHISRK